VFDALSGKREHSARKRQLFAAIERTVAHGQRFAFSCRQKRWSVGMTTRSKRETVHFKHSFRIKGIDRLLPPGAYEVVTDEEMIEGLSFPVFHRVATMIMVPGAPPRHSST
jgi:hypothetical protein